MFLVTYYGMSHAGEVFLVGIGAALGHASLKWCLGSPNNSGKSGIRHLEPLLPAFPMYYVDELLQIFNWSSSVP